MYCLRCGREIPDGGSFCEECAKTVREPLEESPYLSTRVILPTQAGAAAKTPPKPVKLPEKKQERKGTHRLKVAVVWLSLLCALLAAACGYGVKLYFDSAQEHTLLLLQQEENWRLQSQLSNKDNEITEQKDKVSQLSARLTEAEDEITRLEQMLNTYRIQGSEIDQSLRELQEDNLQLTEENKAYAAQVETLEKQEKTLKDKISALENRNATLEQLSSFIDRHVVFIENDGTGYYHSYWCSRFKKQSYWAYSTNLAISQGYTPCPNCQ